MSPAWRRLAAAAALVVAGGATATATTAKLPGSLGFLQWNPDPARSYAPQLAALSLATNATTPLVDFPDNSYESSYIKITAFDAAAGLWTVNLQYQGDDNVGLLAEVNVTHGKAALLRTVNSTFCFYLAADPRDENTLLCLTQDPYYTPPGAAPRSVTAAGTRRDAGRTRRVHPGMLARGDATAATATAPGDDTLNSYYVKLDRTTGAATYVSTWMTGASPANEALTYDEDKHILYAMMVDNTDFTTYVVGIDAATGAVASKLRFGNVIFYCFAWHAGTVYSLMTDLNSGWATFLAAVDLATGQYSPVGALTNYGQWFQWNGASTVAPVGGAGGTLFTTMFSNQTDPLLWVVGVDLAGGDVVYAAPTDNAFIDIVYLPGATQL